MQTLKGKHIVLGISGGIAAYKSAYLLRLFIKAGAEVQVVITPNGKEFITPATLSALSGKPVVSEFFAANTGEWHSHVDLGLWSDLMVIAPATASTIGKMANGVADNMLITTYLSAKSPVMVAPAMDLDMWAHPSTQRNIRTLEQDGVEIIQPGSGELASHLTGKGRMEEPEEILRRVECFFSRRESLRGKRILVTAGPTYEDIDPVRFIGNYSSGKMGFAIAEEAAQRGALVTLVTGPVSIETSNPNIERVDVRSARQMMEAAEKAFEDCDAAILSAAVADYTPEFRHDTKLKRENTDGLELRLVKNPDIAAGLGERKGDRILVGFALETDHEHDNAIAKMRRKGLDMIVLNSLRNPLAGFNKDTNQVTVIRNDGKETEYPAKEKKEVAVDILDQLEDMMASER
ncbi:MAG: bifunctional phosphopantothenoylcysteine decarboxylase/phosphopantothenate--cysteine ligase CoaBC [Muribaculaceae bacterium]|nr:bifunctional phosphopantothenoylcysteine decarboxylase/phosphopantothenate--cysteine ligase CoaBC [Muribaculaceae bacterium]MDE6551659.1 bifunctional phosphopantothenoylcysteine decarboxylase/phosphopantothenate--cysteine ligase CoaBC [Muribaculaceae bacterium]